MQTLASVAAGVKNSAIFGFGGSLGRDIYSGSKKNAGGIILLGLILGIVTMSFFGARAVTRGTDPSKQSEKLIGWLLIVVSLAILVLIPAHLINTPKDNRANLIFGFVGFIFIPGILIGSLTGFLQKPGRLRRFHIAERNQQFLDHFGIQETDESEITHVDKFGAQLRFIEKTDEIYVFLGVGSRNKRAYLATDSDGLFVGYTGLIKLGDERVFYMQDNWPT